MPTLVFSNGILTVSLAYTTRKSGGGLVYQRRVPKDLKDHYGSVFMPRRSLAGRNPIEAAKQVAAWIKQDEAEWASLRAHPTTPEHLRAKVDARLDTWRKLPREHYADEDLPSDAEHFGELLDDYLLSEYGDAYYQLKVDPRFEGKDITPALRSRLSPVDFATYQKVVALKAPRGTPPLLSRALEEYLRAKGDAFERKSGKAVRLALGIVFKTVGDRPIGDYTRDHARQVRDALLGSNIKTTSVRRRLNDIKSVYNTGRKEFDLTAVGNPFEKLSIKDEGDDAQKRESFTPAEARLIADACLTRNDDAAWIVAMMLDTGARLGEVVGLRREDVFLDAPVPHVWIRAHKALGRTVKTAASERKVPLLGMALWAAKAACGDAPWLFPRYAEDLDVKSDAASARLNPWLKAASRSTKTCHCFRHTMMDRLREAQVPEDERQAIVGHGTKTISRKYGDGYSLDYLKERMGLAALVV